MHKGLRGMTTMNRLLAILILACFPTWATTLYVKSTGDNSDGTTLAKAFTTITKSLAKTCGGGADNCSTGGDVIWVAPGTYNEAVTTGIDSPVSELQVKCDNTGVNTASSAGMCIVTPYTSGLTAAPANSTTVGITKNYITIDGFYVIAPYKSTLYKAALSVDAGVTDITINRCFIEANGAGTGGLYLSISGIANHLIKNTVFSGGVTAFVTLATSAVADYNSNIVFRNCVNTGGTTIAPSGANTYKGGGVRFENCLFPYVGASANSANLSATYPIMYISSAFVGAGAANNNGNLIEDWNTSNVAPTNTVVGANSLSDGSYPYMYDWGASMLMGLQPRFPWSPVSQSPLAGWANRSYSGVTSIPGTVATATSGVGSIDWTDPNNVKQRDTVLAHSDLAAGEKTYYLKCSNFGFAIPGGATIKSVVVSIGKHAADATRIKDYLVYIIDETGTIVTTENKADTTNAWGTANTFVNGFYGNVAGGDDWALALTPAIVNDADFGVAIAAQNYDGASGSIANIDVVRMTVYYTSESTTDILGITRPAVVSPGPGESKQFQRGGNVGHAN